MRFLKILIQAIVFIGLLLIIIQNQDVFTHEFELGIDLEIWNSGTFITMNIVIIAAAFLLGVLLTIFWGAFSSASKSATIKQQRKKIKELEKNKPETPSIFPEEETGSSARHDTEPTSSPFKAP